MVIRRELPDGRVFASLSVTMLALTPSGIRYDFTGAPATRAPSTASCPADAGSFPGRLPPE
nr:hypothetical protein GCM10020093_027220 [Planobispora longispora]